ncbi:MAG: hypothetical protein CMF49_03170 [Legionellales bacterium]|nr:hypothetical protein [Legionellales bacterium]
MKQKISWKKTCTIYWYHYLQVSIYSCLLLFILLAAGLLASHFFHFSLWAILQKPKYSIPMLSIFIFIQYFPINIYVLKCKTFQKNFDGFMLQLTKNDKESS